MGLPFQCLSPLGRGSTLFCAARGCSILTFDLDAGPQPLFSWTHPLLRPAGNANEEVREARASQEGEGRTEQQPPSKRRRIGSDGAEPTGGTGHEQGTADAPANGEKNQKKGKSNRPPPRPEAPFLVLLAATEDGRHVIAVTGQDKTLWVFEHDGKGSLKEISQRAMPKRPCSLALTADGQTILSADKFGDVYALPLIPQSHEDSASASAAASPAAVPVPPQALRGANVFTVHSQRNRRALEDQQRQREANAKRDLPKEGPKFAHEVLLGHVSMLTCVLTARDSCNRSYIITADRDEHIRVSRGMPQSHVVEAYCLGHGSFVNALCNPCSRPDVVVSGGGDDEIFVWDWLAGKLLGTVDLLSRVRDVLPDATKVAVVKLIAYEADDECHIAAICERVPALFIFQLGRSNTLSHRATLGLLGNALDITTLGVASRALLVTVDADADDAGQVSIFERDGKLWTPRASIQGMSGLDRKLALSRENLDEALYTVENLRKTELGEEGDEAAPIDMPGQNA
ncbi:putative wd repeat domain-containing protein [Rosellinia necatrix]|uniref:Putative wd repeat domain-containing protein n=1 Tax=Rosellinia necatrix TaxID=77044 RepID=A0A1W2TDX5_ROSNE|nr:putative wd repeat domain-containing protein [Rosellinia necatrix]